MRALVFILLLAPLGAISAPDQDGFIWIDANTRIKTKPESAAGGSSAPEKAPEPQRKPKARKKADKE